MALRPLRSGDPRREFTDPPLPAIPTHRTSRPPRGQSSSTCVLTSGFDTVGEFRKMGSSYVRHWSIGGVATGSPNAHLCVSDIGGT